MLVSEHIPKSLALSASKIQNSSKVRHLVDCYRLNDPRQASRVICRKKSDGIRHHHSDFSKELGFMTSLFLPWGTVKDRQTDYYDPPSIYPIRLYHLHRVFLFSMSVTLTILRTNRQTNVYIRLKNKRGTSELSPFCVCLFRHLWDLNCICCPGTSLHVF